MRASPRIVVVVLATSFFIEPAWAQQAASTLRAVESGTIDALRETGTIRKEREVCLREGLYVLAFALEPGHDHGRAIVGLGPGKVAADVQVSASHQDGWAWDSFEVDVYTCYRFIAVLGRARVYEVRVKVAW